MSIKLNNTMEIDSKECIVPITIEHAGVKLRSGQKSTEPQTFETKIKINLSDCVQCSGCITSAEEVFISSSNKDSLLREIYGQVKTKVMVSMPSLFSLCSALNCTSDQLLGYLNRTLSPLSFVSEEKYMVESLNQMASEVINAGETPVLATHCPAVRMFIQKRCPSLYPYLTKSASPMELFFVENPAGISIQQCQDRKLEAYRYQAQCFTAGDFLAVLKGLSLPPIEPADAQPSLKPRTVLMDLPKYLEQQFGPADVAKGQNRDQLIFAYKNGRKMTHQMGMRNLENLMRRATKIGPGELHYLEACPRGCYGGASLAFDAQGGKTLSDFSVQLYNEAMDRNEMPQLTAVQSITATRIVLEKILTPEEIAKQKGVSGVALAQMDW